MGEWNGAVIIITKKLIIYQIKKNKKKNNKYNKYIYMKRKNMLNITILIVVLVVITLAVLYFLVFKKKDSLEKMKKNITAFKTNVDAKIKEKVDKNTPPSS